MKVRIFLFSAAVCLLAAVLPAGAEVFRFRFTEGQSYRINSLVNEEVYLDGVHSHTAEITNRITVNVSGVQTENGRVSARHDCTFMTSERNENGGFAWNRRYESVFRREENGRYRISAGYFMPVVRDIPVFPDMDLQPGDRWQADGEEAHDFREFFGIPEPYRIPFTAQYAYIGPVETETGTLHHIQAEYEMTFATPEEILRSQQDGGFFPLGIRGVSRQQLYWDNEAGALSHYTEEFHIQIEVSTGQVIDYVGTSSAAVHDNPRLDREQMVEEMEGELHRRGIENARVSATEEGVTISIENIHFAADTARLLPGEEEKIRKIAEILAAYPGHDLLVSGHTALAGTAEARQRLSEERAETVAAMLIESGTREAHNVFTQGFGAERPCAPNDTEENRARNRRVEITILEK